MSDIFISYASKDHARVIPLVRALEQQGWSVWWDRTILPGKKFDEVIEKALTQARCVLVLWSRHSVNSDWVRAEAEDARKRQVLVPVLLDEVQIPLAFRRLQAARLTEWKGATEDSDFQQLCRAVSDVFQPAQRNDRSAQTAPESSMADELPGTSARQDRRGLRPARSMRLVFGLSSGVALLAIAGYFVLAGSTKPTPVPERVAVDPPPPPVESAVPVKSAMGEPSTPRGGILDVLRMKETPSLDKVLIKDFIDRHINEVKYCYERELTKQPDLSGRVTVQFTIATTGQVIASTLQSSTMDNYRVESCVREAVRRWVFPKPNDIVVVSYPFVFTPGNAGE